MSTIGLVVTLKVQPGKESEFEAVFTKLRAEVKANETGCLQYDVFRSKQEPGTYVITEQYASAEALGLHGKTPYFTAAQPALGATLAGAPTMLFLDKVVE